MRRRKIPNNIPDLPRSEWEHLIDEWIFSERDRSILKRYLLDNICFEPLAEEFELSVRQTKTIVYRTEEILFKHCTKTAQYMHDNRP
jgi:predicted DNA-binding protein YlxM (UPF0122 family)